ncbi:4-oxalomesaconate tautomerase [Rhodobacteraceae bacterium N5(2021)]|uniref:4-oxalomesaconate tautomerase n=1 Tax=Gymnodinialimonas phycosphaerae TaxID=2841589 RepID=A0A975TXQ0_9RHOB|nr:4-oxalomesaconate tautomerase [Gymnodinialimonas phycosphaerae]MBY4891805.1 4-oxalomesaconate tautomerase [Gymnodinialimonas phycosphaerae]
MSEGVRCMWMRGGTSKGGYILAEDLPNDRDAFLMRIMSSPDPRQIDGMGGADSLTSKIAVVSKSARDGVDVDYLFLQVGVEREIVSDGQNCGNILSGVAPFAIERGLITAQDDYTRVVVYMENTGQTAIATVQTPDGMVSYSGNVAIDGVPGTAAPIPLEFVGTAGSTCGALLPTGNVVDVIEGVDVTMIDNGMPVVILRASDMGATGAETREDLDADTDLKALLEVIRLACGPLMNLRDVSDKTVPKMTLISPPQDGGAISTRTFVPHRCHASIGVLGAVSVATACLLPGAPAAELAHVPAGSEKVLAVEHPIGATKIVVQVSDAGDVTSAAILRTARKLMDGKVFTS